MFTDLIGLVLSVVQNMCLKQNCHVLFVHIHNGIYIHVCGAKGRQVANNECAPWFELSTLNFEL